MRNYEVMFITAPTFAEDDLKKLTSQLETIITDQGGKITKIDAMGRRKLAYRIGKFDEGIYQLLYVEGSGREIAEVERRLRVNDQVIRHLTVRTDDEQQRAAKIKAKRKNAVAPRDTNKDFQIDLDLEDDDYDEL